MARSYRGVGTIRWGAQDGKDGDNGLPGQIPIQKEWVVGDAHRNTDEIVDYIYVRGANKAQSYWYKRSAKGTVTAGAPPTGGTTPSGYEKINWLKELAVNVLLAEEANLAGFIFKGGQLISVRGTVGGVAADYSGQANFVPNLILNGAEGDVKITGTVNATSGVFTGTVNATDGSFTGTVYATDGSFTGKVSANEGNIGVLEVDEETGSVVLKSGVHNRIEFINEDIPEIKDIIKNITDSGSRNFTSLGSGAIEGVHPRKPVSTETLIVDKNGTIGTTTATSITLRAFGAKYIDDNMEPQNSIMEGHIKLLKDDVVIDDFAFAEMVFDNRSDEPITKEYTVTIPNKTYSNMSIGEYKFQAYLVIDPGHYIEDPMVILDELTFNISFTQTGYRKQVYGLNGMMFAFENTHLHCSEDEGIDVRGKVNMPGILLSGAVSSQGGWESNSQWGAKLDNDAGGAPSKDYDTVGTYTIPHTIGHLRYQAYASPRAAGLTYHISAKRINSCTIEWRSGSTLTNTDFDIQLVGDNYKMGGE